MYELRKVTKLYRKGRAAIKALDDVSLSLAHGEFLAIQGPTRAREDPLAAAARRAGRPTTGSVLFEGATSLGCERGRSPR